MNDRNRKQTIDDILNQLRDDSKNNHDRGFRFENFVSKFLKTDKGFKNVYSNVWLWKDWEQKEDFGYDRKE